MDRGLIVFAAQFAISLLIITICLVKLLVGPVSCEEGAPFLVLLASVLPWWLPNGQPNRLPNWGPEGQSPGRRHPNTSWAGELETPL